MIAQLRVVKGMNMRLRYAGLVRFAYKGVCSVVGALMTVNMRKHFVWSCFVQIVGKNYRSLKRRMIEILVHPSLLFSMNGVIASVFMARD